MATQARNVSPWGRTVPDGDIVTVSSDRIIAFEIKPTPHATLSGAMFGSLSTAFSLEGSQLTEYFEIHVARSMGSLADPYATAAVIGDPFEYRSVPYREVRTVKTKPKWIGSIPPSPINDD